MKLCQACLTSNSTVLLMCEFQGDVNHEYCHACTKEIFTKGCDSCLFCKKRFTSNDVADLHKMLETSRQIIFQSEDEEYCFEVKRRHQSEINANEYKMLNDIYSDIEKLRGKSDALTPKERKELILLLRKEYLIKHYIN